MMTRTKMPTYTDFFFVSTWSSLIEFTSRIAHEPIGVFTYMAR